jgi:hypothetical protein
MRSKVEKPKPGDRRTVRGFLWFPKEINGESRWLESGEWQEEYLPGIANGGNTVMAHWDPIRWTDQPDVPSRWITVKRGSAWDGERLDMACKVIPPSPAVIRYPVAKPAQINPGEDVEPWYKTQQFGPTYPASGGYEEQGRIRATEVMREACGLPKEGEIRGEGAGREIFVEGEGWVSYPDKRPAHVTQARTPAPIGSVKLTREQRATLGDCPRCQAKDGHICVEDGVLMPLAGDVLAHQERFEHAPEVLLVFPP